VKNKNGSPPNQKELPFGITFLKDWADSIRGRAIFFLPFFAAFIAFMVTKSDYLLNTSNYFLVGTCLVTFACGIAYVGFITETLWLLDSLRFLASAQHHSEQGFMSDKDVHAYKETSAVLIKRLGIEYKLFRWMMWLLYFAVVQIIYDLFFMKWVFVHLEMLFLPHFMK